MFSVDDGGLDSDNEQEQTNVSKFVKLISSEGHEFIVDREVVMASGTIRAMLTGPGVWGETSGPLPTARFENIQTGILERIVQYFHYKAMYDTVELDRPLPNFEIKMDYVLPLMLASHFLDC